MCYWGSAQTVLSCANEFIYSLCFLLCQLRVSGFTYANVFDPLELRFALSKNTDLILFFYMQLSLNWRVLGRYLGTRWLEHLWEQLGSDEHHRGLYGHRGSGCPCQTVVRLGDLNGDRLGRESR